MITCGYAGINQTLHRVRSRRAQALMSLLTRWITPVKIFGKNLRMTPYVNVASCAVRHRVPQNFSPPHMIIFSFRDYPRKHPRKDSLSPV